MSEIHHASVNELLCLGVVSLYKCPFHCSNSDIDYSFTVKENSQFFYFLLGNARWGLQNATGVDRTIGFRQDPMPIYKIDDF